MTMVSRYHGTCRLCGGHIRPGDLIDWDKSQKPAVSHSGGICPKPGEQTTAASGSAQTAGASEKQLGYLDTLFARKELTASDRWMDATQAMDAEELDAYIASMKARASADRKWCSELIGTLKELPWKPREEGESEMKPVVPEGRYAVQVDGQWMLYRVWVGSKYDPPPVHVYKVRGVERGERAGRDEELAALKAIAADPGQAAADFGHRTGFCSRCGVGIEKNITRVIGIGPDCMKHWFENEQRYALNADARARLRAVGIDPEAKDDDVSQVPPKGSVKV